MALKHLILAGAGHAQLAVLRKLAHAHRRDLAVTLVTPVQRQVYSGMLPGCIAGHYQREQCEIDVAALARQAHAAVRLETIVAWDAGRRWLTTSSGDRMGYDVLSLDVGSEVDLSTLDVLGERVVPVRPGNLLLDCWPRLLEMAQSATGLQIVVVGGGAAGVECAMAVRYALDSARARGGVALVVSGDGPVPNAPAATQRRIERLLAHRGIPLHRGPARGTADGVLLANDEFLRADAVIAATGGRAPDWVRDSGAQVDEHGYLSVDAMHRSISHPDTFAAGDVCARVDRPLEHSGVHAVRAGSVVAANLIAVLSGGNPTRKYRPRERSLYLISCGDEWAVVSWGRWSAEGHWAWKWKDHIDRGFVAEHSPGRSPADC